MGLIRKARAWYKGLASYDRTVVDLCVFIVMVGFAGFVMIQLLSRDMSAYDIMTVTDVVSTSEDQEDTVTQNCVKLRGLGEIQRSSLNRRELSQIVQSCLAAQELQAMKRPEVEDEVE